MSLQGVNVIVLPDDAEQAAYYRPDMVAMVTQNMFAMSNDNLRMYVRQSTWDAMQQSLALTNKAK